MLMGTCPQRPGTSLHSLTYKFVATTSEKHMHMQNVVEKGRALAYP